MVILSGKGFAFGVEGSKAWVVSVIECWRLEILRLTSFAQDDREGFGVWVCNIGDILLHGNNIGNVKLED